MKLHYKGKFNGDENSLPQREHPEGAVAFKEPKNMKSLAVIANVTAAVAIVVFGAFAVWRGCYLYSDFMDFFDKGYLLTFFGMILALLSIFPHELLHAICFRGDVELYTNLKQGMLFVVGTEDMSKARFILMNLLPNIVFGFIPYILFMIFPQFVLLGGMGTIAISSGVGDYMNVFNCLKQVPKGGKIYGCGMHSYWYI